MKKILFTIMITLNLVCNFASAESLDFNWNKMNARLASEVSVSDEKSLFTVTVQYDDDRIESARQITYRLLRALTLSDGVKYISASTKLRPLN